MRDTVLRRQKDRLLAPLVSRHFGQVHPNWLSGLALLVGLAAAGAAWQQIYGVGLLLWLLNRTLDGLDGLVARVHHKQSDFGGYLDLFLDYLVYLAVPLGFVAAQPSPPVFWSALALLSSFLLNLLSWSTLSALLEKRQQALDARLTSIAMPTGLIEGAETVVFYALFFLLPAFVAWLFLVMAILVFITAGQRLWWAWRHL